MHWIHHNLSYTDIPNVMTNNANNATTTTTHLWLKNSLPNVFRGLARVSLWSSDDGDCSSESRFVFASAPNCGSSEADGKWCSDNVITRGGVETRICDGSVGRIELSNTISRGADRVSIETWNVKGKNMKNLSQFSFERKKLKWRT